MYLFVKDILENGCETDAAQRQIALLTVHVLRMSSSIIFYFRHFPGKYSLRALLGPPDGFTFF